MLRKYAIAVKVVKCGSYCRNNTEPECVCGAFFVVCVNNKDYLFLIHFYLIFADFWFN